MATLVSSTSERAETAAGSHVTSFVSGVEPEPTAAAKASNEESSEASSAAAETSEAGEEMHGRGVRMFTGKDQPKDQVYNLSLPVSSTLAHAHAHDRSWL